MLLACSIVAPLAAQYNPPGNSIELRDVQDEDELRGALEEADWRFGVVRLQPWISVRDANFVTTSEDDETDFTLTLGAGLRGYLKTGTKVIWAAHALPEYVWWQDNEAKRSLNGRYGLGAFAYFNRLDLEVSWRLDETQSFFSSEIQELTTTKSEVGRFGFEVRIAHPFAVYGSYTHTEATNQEEEAQALFSLLDRTVDRARVGLLYRSPKGYWLGLGWEEGRVDFAPGARDLSNTSEAPFLDAGYEGPRFGAVLQLRRESLEPRSGSGFEPFELTSGLVETQWELSRGVELFLYGRRQLGYSIEVGNSSLTNQRFGARLGLDLRGTQLGVLAEIGEDDYDTTLDRDDRVDDVVAFGMTLSFELTGYLNVNLGLVHTEYDSNRAELDRDVTAWSATMRILPLSDLGLGQNRRIW